MTVADVQYALASHGRRIVERAEHAINDVVDIGEVARHAALPVNLDRRSEEHTSELQSLMRISYAVFCLKKKNTQPHYITTHPSQSPKNNYTSTHQTKTHTQSKSQN